MCGQRGIPREWSQNHQEGGEKLERKAVHLHQYKMPDGFMQRARPIISSFFLVEKFIFWECTQNEANKKAHDWLFVVGPIVLKCEYRPACEWLWGVSSGVK